MATIPFPYVLVIMFPNNEADAIATFTSDKLFTTISPGDLIDCEQERREHGAPLLRAVRSHHKLYQSEKIGCHQVTRIYTEEAADTKPSPTSMIG